MSLSLINIDTTFFKGCLDNWYSKRPRFRVDFVTRLSYLAAWSSMEPRSLQVFVFFFFFCPIDRPTITRDGAMGDETFYWDGLAGTEMLLITSCAGLYLKYLNLISLSGQPTLLSLQKATFVGIYVQYPTSDTLLRCPLLVEGLPLG